MDDFRYLNPAEEQHFRQWARDNWKPDTQPRSVWHPVVRDEWAKIDKEKGYGSANNTGDDGPEHPR